MINSSKIPGIKKGVIKQAEFTNIVQVGTLWIIPGQYGVNITKKPNFFYRFMMRLLLGFKWEDKK